jgi:tetratricopeptide (TPR) repeat protein
MRHKTPWFLAILLAPGLAAAQAPALTTPQQSPKATVEQTVGVTEMKVVYHRPAVNKRKVWGELVPYGEVWRAGANENTVVTFSTDVKVGGKALAAGSYGLHMFPTAKEWTVAFSKTTSAWGSFSYDEKEDALRVTVTPQPSEGFEERLSYRFDDPTDGGVTLALRWEKLKVPLRIEVDTPKAVMAGMRAEMRGLPRFFWQGWNQAARYWINNGGDLTEAAAMSDRALQIAENYQTLQTRAMLLEKKGDAKGAAEANRRALEIATENDLNQYGYTLLGAKKVDEAIAIFEKNVAAHPGSWNVHDSLGEALLVKGNKKAAADSYAKALSLVKDENNKQRIAKTLERIKSGK